MPGRHIRHDVLANMRKITRGAIEDIDRLNPPGEAAEEPAEFVAAGLALSDSFDELVDLIGEAETMEEVEV